MNKRRIIEYLKKTNLIKYVPWRFVKLYINPILTKGKKVKYDSKEYFDSYYSSVSNKEELTDIDTIGTGINIYHSYYHYNILENNIVRYFLETGSDIKVKNFLDIGSGAGHWIEFYNKVFSPQRIDSFDISSSSIRHLQSKYSNKDHINIYEVDVSDAEAIIRNEYKYTIINAIGVIFHIVDDIKWESAITNLVQILEPGGLIIIGGEFGLITQDVEFSKKNNFDSIEEMREKSANSQLFVTKRVRSLSKWKNLARSLGLEVASLQKTKIPNYIITPENNILILRKPTVNE